jgi:AraC-like DNA-binding protein
MTNSTDGQRYPRVSSILGTASCERSFLGFKLVSGPHSRQPAQNAPTTTKRAPLEVVRAQVGKSHSLCYQVDQQTYYVHLLEAGSCSVKSCLPSGQKSHLTLVPGRLLILNPGACLNIQYNASSEAMIFRVSRRLLENTAIEFGQSERQIPMRFESRWIELNSFPNLKHLLSAISLEKPNQPSQMLDYYARLLCFTLIRSVPLANNLCGTPEQQPSHDHRIEQVRRHMLRNIKEDVCIDSLADLCGVSVKTLYNLFNREYGKTPSAYIREMKLAAVHQTLSTQASTPSVTQAAVEYGFTNLSRFASQYKALFHETPSVTLKRTKHQQLRDPS